MGIIRKKHADSDARHPERWFVECKNCKKERKFKSYHSFKAAGYNKDSVCNTCHGNLKIKNNPDVIKKIKKTLEGQFDGEKNPFFGKKHSQATKDEISRKVKANPKNGTGMLGKTVLGVWIEKYGKEIANKKWEEYKKQKSKNSKGNKNPMYGKPSPQGSGNGWSGWYCGWFFRSINELSYMINIIERFKIKWENGELKKFKIEYVDWENKKRNYFPDFILENKYMIECKPKKLWNTPSVLSKKNGAEIFCKKNNLKYKIVCCKRLSIEEIKTLYLENKIKFTKKYEEKFKKYSK